VVALGCKEKIDEKWAKSSKETGKDSREFGFFNVTFVSQCFMVFFKCS